MHLVWGAFLGCLLSCLLLYNKQKELFPSKCLYVVLELEQVFREVACKGFLSIATPRAAETNTINWFPWLMSNLPLLAFAPIDGCSETDTGILLLTNSVLLDLTPVDFCLRQPNTRSTST